MDKWEWQLGGLYDGEVPILWATQTLQGDLLIGRSADYEDLIAVSYQLLISLRSVVAALEYVDSGYAGTLWKGSLMQRQAHEVIEATGL